MTTEKTKKLVQPISFFTLTDQSSSAQVPHLFALALSLRRVRGSSHTEGRWTIRNQPSSALLLRDRTSTRQTGVYNVPRWAGQFNRFDVPDSRRRPFQGKEKVPPNNRYLYSKYLKAPQKHKEIHHDNQRNGRNIWPVFIIIFRIPASAGVPASTAQSQVPHR